MITTNVFSRVFRLKIGSESGTCFSLDIDGKQYIVSAKHLFERWDCNRSIELFHEGEWKKVKFDLVGHCNDLIDISVFAAPFQISPSFALEGSHKGLISGQDVYFLGFPYEISGEMAKINRGFPLPLIKKAIVSSMYQLEDPKGFLILLDGHNNRGFSGGPVVFTELGKNEFKVAAVIAGYHSVPEPIFDGNRKLSQTYKYNTGIIESYGIEHAIELIHKNP